MRLLLVFLSLWVSSFAPLLARQSLPDWATKALAVANAEHQPKGVDAWVLLDRTEYTYTSEGDIRLYRYRLVKVITPEGVSEGTFSFFNMGGKSSKVEKLKGWNFRPGGFPTTVEKSDVVLLDPDSDDEVSSSLVTAVKLPDVAEGSLVAFESRERFRLPAGPHSILSVAERHPILRWELLANKSWWASNDIKVNLIPKNIEAFTHEIETTQKGELRISHIPGFPYLERGAPGRLEASPLVYVAFDDKGLTGADIQSWSTFGKWIAVIFSDKSQPVLLPTAQGGSLREKLERTHQWISREVVYKQIYLSPDRDVRPAPSADIFRRRLGDCKDMVCLFEGALRSMKLRSFPALARIGAGRIPNDVPVNCGVFNHAIAAIPLDESLGLPAEVRLNGQIYLLYDPTDHFSPIGTLGSHHRHGRVLICDQDSPGWVDVPDSAVVTEKVDIELDGAVDQNGQFMGVLTLHEHGDALGLGTTLLRLGSHSMERQVRSLFMLNPSCYLGVLSVSDPRDGRGTLDLKIEIRLPEALLSSGSQWHFAPLGLPKPSKPFQRFGVDRQLPIRVEEEPQWRWKAHIRWAKDLAPLLPSKTLETGIRKATWSHSKGDGALSLTFDMQSKEREWAKPDVKVGLQVLAEDRDAMELFMAAGLELREPIKEKKIPMPVQPSADAPIKDGTKKTRPKK